MQEAIIVPLIAGVIQVLKVSGLPKRYLPLTALTVGVAVGLSTATTLEAAIAGAVFGLSAVGLYEGYKQATS